MKVIYLGTPEFSVAPLESIINSDRHEIVAVVTQPDRPVGRKAIITPSPVKVVAIKNDIPIYQFESIRKEGVKILTSLGADAMITCAYGQILSQEVLDATKLGTFNIHASLLPKYRGASPIQYAIINGEKTTGVTFMKTDAGLDTGDIISQFSVDIIKDETFGELSERLSALAADKVCGVLDAIESGKTVFKKQDDAIASVVKTLKKEDGIIDFTKNCEAVVDLINGLNPWPVAHMTHCGKTIKIFRATKSDMCGNAGEVLFDEGKLVVACGTGAAEITEIQEEGAKRMSAKDYLLGRKLKKGDVLGK